MYNATTLKANYLYTHSQSIKNEHQRNIRYETQRQFKGDTKTNTTNRGYKDNSKKVMFTGSLTVGCIHQATGLAFCSMQGAAS